MPVDTISPFEIAFASIEAAIADEFTDLDLTVNADELHESLGQKGIAIGVAPIRDAPMSGGRPVQETWIHLQWFDLWTKKVDPSQQVDPIPITRKAERLRQALARVRTTATEQVWYFNVEDTNYDRDPTGNKTRFVMRIRAYGNNAGLLETGV